MRNGPPVPRAELKLEDRDIDLWSVLEHCWHVQPGDRLTALQFLERWRKLQAKIDGHLSSNDDISQIGSEARQAGQIERLSGHDQLRYPVGDSGQRLPKAPRDPDLGISLDGRQLEQTRGNLADLDETINARQRALQLCPVGHPDRRVSLIDIGTALRTRFNLTGELLDCKRAIRVYEEALSLCPIQHPNRPSLLGGLGSLLHSRSEQTLNKEDLDVALQYHREALCHPPERLSDRCALLANLGGALNSRFRLSRARSDLDEAAASYLQAFSLAFRLQEPERHENLRCFGMLLRMCLDQGGDQSARGADTSCPPALCSTPDTWRRRSWDRKKPLFSRHHSVSSFRRISLPSSVFHTVREFAHGDTRRFSDPLRARVEAPLKASWNNKKEETLAEIDAWTWEQSPETQRVLWLKGCSEADRSAIASEITKKVAASGHLWGSFVFSNTDGWKLQHTLVRCLMALGDAHLLQGRIDIACLALEKALEIGDRHGDDLDRARLLYTLGDIHLQSARYDEARWMLEEALTICRGAGSILGSARCLGSLAGVCLWQGRYEEAFKLMKEELMTRRDVIDEFGHWAHGRHKPIPKSESDDGLGKHVELRRAEEPGEMASPSLGVPEKVRLEESRVRVASPHTDQPTSNVAEKHEATRLNYEPDSLVHPSRVLVLDALDECNQEDMESIISLLPVRGRHDQSTDRAFKVLLTTRAPPYLNTSPLQQLTHSGLSTWSLDLDESKMRQHQTTRTPSRYGLEGPLQGAQTMTLSPRSAIASGAYSDCDVRLWDITTGACTSALYGHSTQVTVTTFSSDGSRLASGSLGGAIRLWDVVTRVCIAELEGHTGPVVTVVFFPDGSGIVSASKDDTIRIWDITTGRCSTVMEGVAAITALSPDGLSLVSGDSRAHLVLWDVNSASQVWNSGNAGIATAVEFFPNGARIVSTSNDKGVHIWDAASGAKILTFEHPDLVTTIAVSPDSKEVATGSHDGTVRIWSSVNAEHLVTLEGHSSSTIALAFSCDGLHLTSGSKDVRFCTWDVGSGTCVAASTRWSSGTPEITKHPVRPIHQPKNAVGKAVPNWNPYATILTGRLAFDIRQAVDSLLAYSSSSTASILQICNEATKHPAPQVRGYLAGRLRDSRFDHELLLQGHVLDVIPGGLPAACVLLLTSPDGVVNAKAGRALAGNTKLEYDRCFRVLNHLATGDKYWLELARNVQTLMEPPRWKSLSRRWKKTEDALAVPHSGVMLVEKMNGVAKEHREIMLVVDKLMGKWRGLVNILTDPEKVNVSSAVVNEQTVIAWRDLSQHVLESRNVITDAAAALRRYRPQLAAPSSGE
ncbi:hypothetical protein FRB96_001729 [Tulasnella sp. 330]|nr:hypothetical protein FRB96_001729 [Tulasnella sp. 330]